MQTPSLIAKYLDDLAAEDEVLTAARDASGELGITAVAPSVGAQLAAVAAATQANAILEVGTGAGVSGLWLLRGAPGATLTSIDTELDHQQHARAAFSQAGIPVTRARLITGKARDLLPRMNEASYDIVFLDADTAGILEYVEHALALVRVGGSVLVAHALLGGRVADPAQRDDSVADVRALLKELSTSDAVRAAVSPVGDGLLQIVRLPEPTR
ncbi:methyltransferase domain-containing protein [Agrococcus sediminis]|uniref:Methyltransferase domain-containing protein n=2 Tax=Bacteria TaxID=2 RepID=A0A5M8QDI6_9MICO|nr:MULTISPECIES: class I SAM-dependent methyltransferase [Agrococcus]KAA6432960.1 methyltransferase domain-containing protein [Agrococcus sediminis]MDR7234237.1 putative O-methyltransferase YrrM [Agrococcus sp. BE272]RWR22292.1 methyltransferase domain-containing protein [Agrococcus lahaulensis]UOW00953.1 class I SAM-dependent methyltransferase [Agrococcus sp. SCSIO52902]